MILRPYQSRDVENIRSLFQKGLKRICYAAPTGSGKTILFCFAARRTVENGRRASPVGGACRGLEMARQAEHERVRREQLELAVVAGPVVL